MKIKISNRLLVYALVGSFSLTSSLGVSTDSIDSLATSSFFSERPRTEIDTIAFLTSALSFLKNQQSLDQFELEIKLSGLEGMVYRFEESPTGIEAIRFRSRSGSWFRVGREPLKESDPELGFLVPSGTEKIEDFWLESFERTVPVKILVPGTALGAVVKVEGVNFAGHVPQEAEGVDVVREKEILEKMKQSIFVQYDQLIEEAADDEIETILLMEKFAMDNICTFKDDKEIGIDDSVGPAVSTREAVMRVIGVKVKKLKEMYETAKNDDVRRIAQNGIVTAENIGQRMIDFLDGVDRLALLDKKISEFAKNGQKVILVGKILPSYFLVKNRSAISGIVTDEDQLGSHNAIEAKNAGIAFAKNAGRLSSLEQELKDGDIVALEMVVAHRGGRADLTLNPEPTHRFRIVRKTVEKKVYQMAVTTLKSKTRDDQPVRLYLNTSVHNEFPWEKGEYPHLGLVRSDFTYLQSDVTEPDLKYLTQEYTDFFERARKAGVEEINFRTFDLDLADKWPKYFKNSEKKEGIDFSLNDPQGLEAFKTQVKAIFVGMGRNLTEGPPIHLNLLFPKVRRVEEFHRASVLVREIWNGLRKENADYDRIKYQLGIMVETKEALDNIESFMGEVDFINVGTNDLTLSLYPDKVTRVVKKGKEAKAPISDYYHRVLWALEKIVKAAASYPNISRQPPICVCGDLASYKEYGLFLLGLGYSGLTLSMPYENVLDLKLHIAAHDYSEIREYAEQVTQYVEQAENKKGEEIEKSYADLKKYLDEKRSEMEVTMAEYLTFDWARQNISADRLIQILGQVLDSIERISKNAHTQDHDDQRREVATILLDQGVFTPSIMEKSIEHGWDLEEFLTALEVWAYQKLIDQGTFFVYRARKIGDDYWIRVLPTGEEYRWKSRYDRRIIKKANGSVWIRAGNDLMLPANRIELKDEPEVEVYVYEEDGKTFYARKFEVRGISFTYVKAGPEKDYIIKLFRTNKSLYGQDEKLYLDKGKKAQIVHIPDWTRHPVFQDLPYDTDQFTPSALFFLLRDDPRTGEMTWGQNMARPGYGHLFEDNARALEMLIKQLKIVDKQIKRGREEFKRIKALLEVERHLREKAELERRIRDLEDLSRKLGASPAIIQNPALFEMAA